MWSSHRNEHLETVGDSRKVLLLQPAPTRTCPRHRTSRAGRGPPGRHRERDPLTTLIAATLQAFLTDSSPGSARPARAPSPPTATRYACSPSSAAHGTTPADLTDDDARAWTHPLNLEDMSKILSTPHIPVWSTVSFAEWAVTARKACAHMARVVCGTRRGSGAPGSRPGRPGPVGYAPPHQPTSHWIRAGQ
jgi:hypothetical protein